LLTAFGSPYQRRPNGKVICDAKRTEKTLRDPA
jgi:hypothetical protein